MGKSIGMIGISILIIAAIVSSPAMVRAEGVAESAATAIPAAAEPEPAAVIEEAAAAEAVQPESAAPAEAAVQIAAAAEAEAAAPAAAEAALPAVQPDSEGVFPSLVHKGDINDFLRILSAAAHKNIIPSSQVRGVVNVNLFEVTFTEALEAVLTANGFAYEEKGPFIFVYTQKEFQQIQIAARKTESKSFHLNYIPAKDVQEMIAPLLSDKAKVTTSPESLSNEKSGETWAVSNYVVVVDYPENLAEVEALIAKMDRRPPQVLVEATIMVASLEDKDELGIDFNVLSGVDFQAVAGFPAAPGGTASLSGTNTGVDTGFTGNVTDGGLSIGIVNSNIGMFIKAIESITDTVTLGNPKVLTLNRQLGKVIVGNRDGYITTEVSQTTATQTVEFLETGTQLSFRPFVMEDGYIRMELNPKDSDGGVTVTGEFTLPSEKTAEVTTNVLVQDGRTIVIGGLFRDKTTLNRSQIPLLGNLPLIGTLFRSTVDDNSKEEVIFLITPHIVKEEKDYALAEKALDNCQRRSIGIRDGMQWHSRERLAAAHYDWAKQHQASGNLDSALWDITLATDMNPGSLDAQRLRDQLLTKKMYRAEDGSMHLFMRQLIERDFGN